MSTRDISNDETPPASSMNVLRAPQPLCNESDDSESLCSEVLSEDSDEGSVCSIDSFIASEGTPSVYDTDTEASFSDEDEDEEDKEDEEVKEDGVVGDAEIDSVDAVVADNLSQDQDVESDDGSQAESTDREDSDSESDFVEPPSASASTGKRRLLSVIDKYEHLLREAEVEGKRKKTCKNEL